MKKSYRVKKNQDFQALFDAGKSAANRKFVVYHLPRGQAHYRLGLSVSKRLGNAVTRNRIKRRLRHIVKELENQLETQDFVIICRQGVQELDYQEMKKNLIHVLTRAHIYQKEKE